MHHTASTVNTNNTGGTARRVMLVITLVGALIFGVSMLGPRIGPAYPADVFMEPGKGGYVQGSYNSPITQAPPSSPSSSPSSPSSSPQEQQQQQQPEEQQAGKTASSFWARGTGGRIVRTSFSSKYCDIRPTAIDAGWSVVCSCEFLTTSDANAKAASNPVDYKAEGGGGDNVATVSGGVATLRLQVQFAQPILSVGEIRCALRSSPSPTVESNILKVGKRDTDNTGCSAIAAAATTTSGGSDAIRGQETSVLTIDVRIDKSQARCSAGSPVYTKAFAFEFDLKLVARDAVARSWRTCFVSIGDWGRNQADALRVAQQLEKTASQLPELRSVVSTGDNFYPVGVKSVNDPQFEQVFEKMYSGPALKRLMWVLSGGNHDQWGMTGQLEYGVKRSDRWFFPRRWYAIKMPLRTLVTTATSGGDAGGDDWRHRNISMFILDTYGPHLDNQLRSMLQFYKYQEQETSAMRNNWRVVVGHIPLFSGSHHGQQAKYAGFRAKITPTVLGVNAHAYLNGDDHLLEIHRFNGTDFFVSGAGGGSSRYGSKKLETTRKSWPNKLGFMVHCFEDETMTTEAVVLSGTDDSQQQVEKTLWRTAFDRMKNE